ncbi:50S ribosomal protein L17 [bacterium BMS3Bbin04]|nr:50S ribosomal protein L17 [bacterium BMS3Bbin04]
MLFTVDRALVHTEWIVRHQKTNFKLNRTASHRKALLMNQTRALIEHKKITTTLAKAKATRSYAERLITFAKKDDIAARRQVLKKLHNRDAVKMLFHEIGPRFRDRNGGYTRIIKLENRSGDNAPMAILELVGFAVDEPVKQTRSRAARKKQPKKISAPKTEAAAVVEEAVADATEEVAEAEAVEETVEAEAVEEKVEAEVAEEAPVEAAAEETPVEEEKKPEVEAEAAEESTEEASDDSPAEGDEGEKKD